MENDIKIKKKNIVQDVMPPTKKTIRSVELPSRRKLQSDFEASSVQLPVSGIKKKGETPPQSNFVYNPPKAEQPETPYFSPKKSSPVSTSSQNESHTPSYAYIYDDEPVRKSKKLIYVTACIFILALTFGVSALFKSAKITITPKHQTNALNANFTAIKDDSGKSLAFQVVTVSKDSEKTVAASSEKQVDIKATGQIVIFNTNSTSQKLIATTRFQTPEGLIFRLINPVNIPASQIKSGKTVAGSIAATVEADVAGDSYNIGLKDFLVPSFKGTSKYSQVYARSKTVMSGGFSGKQKVVSSDAMTSADADLENDLKTKLSTDIVSQIPANFVLYKDALTFTFTNTTQAGSNDTGAILQKRGTAYAVIFDKGSLTRSIVANILPNNSDLIKIPNINDLVISFPDGKSFDSMASSTTLNFNLAGNANLVWVLDENKLKSDLLGLTKTQAREIISKYPSITEVWLETQPFWNQTIPNDTKKVTLINTLAN